MLERELQSAGAPLAKPSTNEHALEALRSRIALLEGRSEERLREQQQRERDMMELSGRAGGLETERDHAVQAYDALLAQVSTERGVGWD